MKLLMGRTETSFFAELLVVVCASCLITVETETESSSSHFFFSSSTSGCERHLLSFSLLVLL